MPVTEDWDISGLGVRANCGLVIGMGRYLAKRPFATWQSVFFASSHRTGKLVLAVRNLQIANASLCTVWQS